ncbi:hypothetical protein EK904_002456, partial [Melospiza melodia maxima]
MLAPMFTGRFPLKVHESEAEITPNTIWSYYSVAELKKMMDAFDAWEGRAGDETTSSFEEPLETIHKPQASYDNLLQNKATMNQNQGIYGAGTYSVLLTLTTSLKNQFTVVRCARLALSKYNPLNSKSYMDLNQLLAGPTGAPPAADREVSRAALTKHTRKHHSHDELASLQSPGFHSWTCKVGALLNITHNSGPQYEKLKLS